MDLTILVVTKDKGSFEFLRPAVQGVIDAGHHVKIVAEGLSAAEWKKAGYPLLFEGTEDFRTQPFECDPEAIIREVRPFAVVVGTSVPTNLEQRFAEAANRLRRYVFIAEDTYLAHKRINAESEIILCINPLAAKLVPRLNPPSTRTTIVMGSPAVAKEPLSDAYKAEIDRLRDGNDLLVLYAGHGQPYTVGILEVTLDSVRKTIRNGSSVGLVLKHHPKLKDPDALARIEGLIAEFDGDFPGTILGTPLGSNDLAWEADVTVSHHGTALNVAAAAYRLPVSVRTPETTEGYRKESGLDLYVLVQAGASASISKATDLNELLLSKGPSVLRICEKYPLQVPPNPKALLDAIGAAT